MLENKEFIVSRLGFIISRVNMISNCLPDHLLMYIEEIKVSITNVLKSYGCEYMYTDKEEFSFLDKVTLYTELNSISRDLGICILLSSNNVSLEDAAFNICLIMKLMAEYDTVFGNCYWKGRKRVLK